MIDGQQVTDEELEYVAALASVDSPRHSLEVPQYTAAMLLAATASVADAKGPPAVMPLAHMVAANSRSTGPEVLSPKAGQSMQGLPTALSYEALASMAATRQALLGPGAVGLPAGLLPTSVPSIQSGVLVLTGPASFGLEGTSMRSASSPGSSTVNARETPSASLSKAANKQQLSPGDTKARNGSRRTTTGGIASHRVGGFVVRQATFQY